MLGLFVPVLNVSILLPQPFTVKFFMYFHITFKTNISRELNFIGLWVDHFCQSYRPWYFQWGKYSCHNSCFSFQPIFIQLSSSKFDFAIWERPYYIGVVNCALPSERLWPLIHLGYHEPEYYCLNCFSREMEVKQLSKPASTLNQHGINGVTLNKRLLNVGSTLCPVGRSGAIHTGHTN